MRSSAQAMKSRQRAMSPGVRSAPVKSVEIDALVLLKIMKHCREHMPVLVTGQLLGIDKDDTLEITNSFAFVTKADDEEHHHHDEEDGVEYQLKMMSLLKDVNVDANTVGWYQCTYMGSYLTDATLIETQCEYQETIERSVVLVFDPNQAAVGNLPVKALRVTDDFLDKRRESQRTGQPIKLPTGSASLQILEELPLKIHSPALVEAYLLDWAMSDPQQSTVEFDALRINNQQFMEKQAHLLLGSLDDLAQEQNKLQFFERNMYRQEQMQRQMLERRRAENEARKERGEDLLPEKDPAFLRKLQTPAVLDTVLISKQIQNYCQQINSFANAGFGKLFLLNQGMAGRRDASPARSTRSSRSEKKA